jgi:hypothetical protein
MKEIKHMEDFDEAEVNKEEKYLKGEYKKRQREANTTKEKEINEKKNKDLQDRM